MVAKYIVTENLQNFIRNLRTTVLGYTNEEFGAIIDNRAASWVYTMENGKKVTTITPATLRTIFLAEYNHHLFEMKIKEMKEILNKAIEDGVIKEGTTLEKIYGEKTRVEEGKNVSFIVPPMEIFNGEPQRCSIPKEYFADKNSVRDDIFDESLFATIEKYIPMQYNAQLTPWQEFVFSRYLSRRAKELVKKNNGFKNDYWLLAMYLMNTDVYLTDASFSHLKKSFDVDKESKMKWENLFGILNLNEKFKLKSRYDDENEIYFLNDSGKGLSINNLPIFDIKYNIQFSSDVDTEFFTERIKQYNRLMNKIRILERDAQESRKPLLVPEEYFVELADMLNEWGYDNSKIIFAYGDSFKLIDMFMLIYREFLKQGNNENEAFKNTCLELYNDDIETFLNNEEIGLGIRPDTNYNTVSSISTALTFALMDFFDKNPIPETDTPLICFKDNYLKLQHKFLSVISMDFSDIENLNNAKCAMLNKELEKTLKGFLDENLF